MNWLPDPFTHLFFLTGAGLVFHAILWARNGPFLWRNRRIILWTVAIAELWTLITDPIGGYWRAWLFDPDQVLGIWLLGLTPIEDFFGMAVVSSAAACAVLVFGYSKRRWI
jgi:lycopene cyclase domain-containing protein